MKILLTYFSGCDAVLLGGRLSAFLLIISLSSLRGSSFRRIFINLNTEFKSNRKHNASE